MPTLDGATTLLAVTTALACALVAGVFFAFSNFVMEALARLPAEQGAAAMREINVVVLNPGFLGLSMRPATWRRRGAATRTAGRAGITSARWRPAAPRYRSGAPPGSGPSRPHDRIRAAPRGDCQ